MPTQTSTAPFLMRFRNDNLIVIGAGEDIRTVQTAMDSYDPSVIGYRWDDENPRIQLEPRGQRGYIELRAVRGIQK